MPSGEGGNHPISSDTFAELIINVSIPYPAMPVRAEAYRVFPISDIAQVSALGDISTWLER